MEKGDIVKIKKCPIKKYIGQEGIITNICYEWNCDCETNGLSGLIGNPFTLMQFNKMYKVKVNNVTIRHWATEDCLELVSDTKTASELYDTETDDIERFCDYTVLKKDLKKYGKGEECYYCKHKYNIPGNAHIGCTKFCSGNEFENYGIINGWVINIESLGISCYDPTWKITYCKLFEEKTV